MKTLFTLPGCAKCAISLLAIGIIFLTTPVFAQRDLGKMWHPWQYPKARTYTTHTASGPDYAVDFYFTGHNHANLYLNGEDGLAGVPIVSANAGIAYLLLYDLTDFQSGNFPLINAERVIAGLDPIPHYSFSFDDANQTRRLVDMEFVADSLSWRTLYAHLQINDEYFSKPGVEQTIRQGISELYNNTAPNCGSSYERIAIDLQTPLLKGSLIGSTNNWGYAADEHLHLQVFEGTSFPSCLGVSINLSDQNQVTLEGQKILDNNLAISSPGCSGGTCYHYPALVRENFYSGEKIMTSAIWDSGVSVDLRIAPGGAIVTTLESGVCGTIISGPITATSPDGKYHLWWECAFTSNVNLQNRIIAAESSGWIPAEYITRTFLPTQVVAWGINTDGQNQGIADNDIISVSSGTGHNLALKANGSIVAWGRNSDGQCNVLSPNNNFLTVTAGSAFSLGVKNNGSIAAWGWNDYGQCNVPTPNTDFVAVIAGGAHSLGLKRNGTILAWGANNYGQCNVPFPNQNFIAIEVGDQHSLGLKADGSIIAWGGNSEGQCNIPEPNSGFTKIATGMGKHSVGLKDDNSLIAWGWNSNGQCNIPNPNSDFITIGAGEYHSLGIKSNGSIIGWGGNSFGQCNVPDPNTNFIMVRAGAVHSIGLRTLTELVDASSNELIIPQKIFLAIEPNPTSEIIKLRFSAPTNSPVTITIYDVSGKLIVRRDINKTNDSEMQTYSLRNRNLANGIYFCKIKTNRQSTTKSFTVLK